MTDAPRLSGSNGAKGKRGFSKLLQRKKRSQRAAYLAENQSHSSDSVGLSPVEVGVGRFNDEPADGVRYFMEGGCGESLASLPAVARVLSQRSGVDREQLAHYLGTEGRELLSAVLDTLSFKFRGVDMALRQLFYVIRLPNDPASVDQILLAFAEKFHKESEEGVAASVQAIYAVALATVRLNADFRNGDRVSKFVRLLSGMDDSGTFNEDRLADIRDAVCGDEIRDREDDPFPDALERRWLHLRGPMKARRMWVVLGPVAMFVLRSQQRTDSKHVIGYDSILSVSVLDKAKPGFQVVTAERELLFNVNSVECAHQWVEKLQKIISAAVEEKAEATAMTEATYGDTAQKVRAMLSKSAAVDLPSLTALLNLLAGSHALNDGLLHAAIRRNDPQLVTTMLTAGVDPNCRAGGVPAIGLAARRSDIGALEALLEAGADPTVTWEENALQWTPLLAACHSSKKAAAKLLLESGKLEDSDVNFMVEAEWLSAKRVPMLSRAKTVVDLQQASRSALNGMRLQQSVMALAKMQQQVGDVDDEDEQKAIAAAEKKLTELESKWKTILQVTTDKGIKALLLEHGAKPASGLIQSWLGDHTKRSMGALCRRLAAMPQGGHPVILVPGYCSSVLECWESQKRPDWVSARVWVAIGLMTASALNGSGTNDWLQHIMLNEDCSDPEGIRVRPPQGLHSVDYLVEGLGTMAKDASYVYGHIIRAFMAAGYTPKKLAAFSYDWRLPPTKLEERDGAFSLLSCQIEGFVRVNRKRVVLIGHSMGNMFVHYFLFWAQKHLSQTWINKHVRLFVAMGAPWAGSAKVARSLNTGDAVGLDMLLTYAEGVAFCRRNASLGWLFPAVVDSVVESCMYVSSDKASAQAVPLEEVLRHVTTFKTMMAKHYDSNDLHGAILPGSTTPTRLRPPPVTELLCIHGNNLPTEVGAVYRELRKPLSNKYGEPLKLKLDVSKKRGKAIAQGNPGLTFKGGLLQEVPWEDDDGIEHCSGDGTVSWESLTYYRKWIGQEGAPRIRQFIVEGAEHRDMLGMPDVIGGLLSRLAMLG